MERRRANKTPRAAANGVRRTHALQVLATTLADHMRIRARIEDLESELALLRTRQSFFAAHTARPIPEHVNRAALQQATAWRFPDPDLGVTRSASKREIEIAARGKATGAASRVVEHEKPAARCECCVRQLSVTRAAVSVAAPNGRRYLEQQRLCAECYFAAILDDGEPAVIDDSADDSDD